MFLQMASRIRRRRSSATALTLSQQVEAILSGTNGFALDPSDTATLWQDTAASVAVAALNDPVRRINAKWGTLGYNLQSPADASRPLWNAVGALNFDGADDRMLRDTNTFGQNVPVLFATARANFDTLTSRSIFQVSTNASGNPRLYFRSTATGAVEVLSRRLDADATTTVTSSAGVLVAGNTYTITVVINFASGGSISVRVNGTEIATGTLAGTPANTSNTATARIQFGAVSTGSSFMDGRIGRLVTGDFLPTGAQITTVEDWVAEVFA